MSGHANKLNHIEVPIDPPPPPPTPTSEPLKKVLGLLKHDQDEQKFVGLLLATKLMKTSDDLTKVFKAAMPFTRRLLLSPNDTDTCLYRGLALSVLASFGSEPSLAAKIDWGTCVASAAPLLKDDDLPPEARRDLVTVLIQLMMQPDGLYHGLLSTDIAPVAARVRAGPAASSSGDSSSSGALPATTVDPSGEAACALIEHVGALYTRRCKESRRRSASTLQLVAAINKLAPAVGTARDAMAFSRLSALRALIEAVATQMEGEDLTPKPEKPSETEPEEEKEEESDSSSSSADSGEEEEEGGEEGEDGPIELEPSDDQEQMDVAASAVRELGPILLHALSAPLKSKLPPAARGDALRSAASVTALCGPHWLVGPLEEPKRKSGGAAASSGGGTGKVKEDGKKGALLSLVIQLCSVELQMCLHDQPSDEPIARPTLAVLPAACALLEEALFRLHSDFCFDLEEEEEGGNGNNNKADPRRGYPTADKCDDPWLTALTDEQVLSAQRAFQRMMMVCLEFLEALRTEEAESAAKKRSNGGEGSAAGDAAAAAAASSAAAPVAASEIHPFLPPVARLVTAWLAQPSAATMMELYDRACSLLRMIKMAAKKDRTAWAGLVHAFEPAERGPPPEDAEEDGSSKATEETMAELFSRLMPQARPPAQP